MANKRREIKTVYQYNKRKIWMFLNMVCSIIYLIWRMFFTIPFEYGMISVFVGISLLIVEVLGMIEAFIHFSNMYSIQRYTVPDVPNDLFPEVDVFIATYSEECTLLYKTINGCKHMEYPDKRKVHIYLCDDNRRPEMRALAVKMGIHYLDRPDNKGAKAGNLNNALAHSTSPYVVTFDADMIPKSDFLMKTIPYFVDCEVKNNGRKEEDQIKLGFLQSPQCFYNPDLFQFNLFSEGRIPNEQDYFYKDIQVARTKTNSVIYGGSNTVLLREALESVGGFYTEAITEDFATGILIQKKGYVSLGTGEPLASGMSATDLQSLIQQRIRWARGVIATGRKMHFFTSKELSFGQKINYWASVWYWYAPIKRIIYIMSPIMYAAFGFMVFKCTLAQVLIFWLPMYITSNVSLRMLSNNIRTTKWTSIYETIMFPFMLLPVILESFGITLKKFKVTEKKSMKNQKGNNLIYTIPFLILIALSAISIINCIVIMFDSGSFGPIVVLFWLVNNLYLLIMSLFFVDGRIAYRKTERVQVGMPCEIDNGIIKLSGVTRDISETGVSILLEEPYYLEAESEVEVYLYSEKYRAKLKTVIIFVNQYHKQWNYSMKILDYCHTYDDYLQMLYDRIPKLPQEIQKNSGSFDDLKLNTKHRTKIARYQKRQYPRIYLDTLIDYYLPKEAGNIEIQQNLNVLIETPIKNLSSNHEIKQDEKNQDEKNQDYKNQDENGTNQRYGEKMSSTGKIKIHDFNYCFTCVESNFTPKYIVLQVMEGICFKCTFIKRLRSEHKLYRVENSKEIISNPQIMKELVMWLNETNTEAIRKQEEYRKREKLDKKRELNQKEFDEMRLV